MANSFWLLQFSLRLTEARWANARLGWRSSVCVCVCVCVYVRHYFHIWCLVFCLSSVFRFESIGPWIALYALYGYARRALRPATRARQWHWKHQKFRSNLKYVQKRSEPIFFSFVCLRLMHSAHAFWNEKRKKNIFDFLYARGQI